MVLALIQDREYHAWEWSDTADISFRNRDDPNNRRPQQANRMLDPCGLAARSDPPVVPSGPLGVSPDPPLCPPVLVVSLCPPVLLVSLLIPPRVLRCPWCLLDPTVV